MSLEILLHVVLTAVLYDQIVCIAWYFPVGSRAGMNQPHHASVNLALWH